MERRREVMGRGRKDINRYWMTSKKREDTES
jgi:hypothetical protein